jgi:hypothetical protein
MTEPFSPEYHDEPIDLLGELTGAVEQTQNDQKTQLEAWREFAAAHPDLARLALQLANNLDGDEISAREAFLRGLELPFLLERQKRGADELSALVHDPEPDDPSETAA